MFYTIGIVVVCVVIAFVILFVRTLTLKKQSMLAREKRVQINCAVRWIAEQIDQSVFPPDSNYDHLMDLFTATLKKAITPLLDKNLGHLTLQFSLGEPKPDLLLAEAVAAMGIPFNTIRLRDGDYLYAHIEPESVITSRDPSGAIRYTTYSRKRDLRYMFPN